MLDARIDQADALAAWAGAMPAEKGETMWVPSTVESAGESMAGREGARVDRRTVLVGVGCACLAAAFPSGALATRAGKKTAHVAARRLPRQSPINFRERSITFARQLPQVRFSYPPTDVTLVNTGSPDEFATVRAEVPAGAAHITIRGVRWDLQQFHWHTPSEHEIGGRDTPLEMHFVHSRGNAVLVIGVFIERGRANRAIAPIFRDLPARADDTRLVPGVRLRRLLPDDRKSFRYSGSLTTPPFSEPVRFIVFADPITLSRRQIGAFRRLFDEGNSREVQPLNGRRVRSDARRVFARR
jgi:carbonic anhydrase